MKVSDLSANQLGAIKVLRFDRIVEKHEGPEDWSAEFEYGEPEFINVEGHPVLLPLDGKQRPNVKILRSIESRDGNTLTLFLQDTTFVRSEDERDAFFSAGFLAVCERMPGEDYFVAIVYHEWFMVPFINGPRE